MISHPLFISLDGGEGAGKSTQKKMLETRLSELYPRHEFLFTREPGGTELGVKIRELIMSANDADAKIMFGLFAADRAAHLKEVVLPALKEGKVVITDRFAAATFAYQVCAMENPISADFFDEYYYQHLEVRPDLTLVFDLDPSISEQRVTSRTSEAATHFDVRPREFHAALREGFKKFARLHNTANACVEIIDADGSPEEVHQRIMKQLIPFLGG